MNAPNEAPERIYLAPRPEDPDVGRLWCEDNVWEGDPDYADDPLATEYVRADLVERDAPEPGERERRIMERLNTMARKAAWMLDNGATGESRDLCEDVVETRARAADLLRTEPGLTDASAAYHALRTCICGLGAADHLAPDDDCEGFDPDWGHVRKWLETLQLGPEQVRTEPGGEALNLDLLDAYVGVGLACSSIEGAKEALREIGRRIGEARPTTPTEPEDTMDGATLIAEERRRQVTEKGYDAEHDAGHSLGEILTVATEIAAYVDPGSTLDPVDPWGIIANTEGKGLGEPHETVRLLTIAGALIAAEIDRILEPTPTEPED